MGEIRVHLDDVLRTRLECMAKPHDVGCPEPHLPRPVEDTHVVGVLQGQVVGDLTRAVGRVVVDD